MEFVVLPDLPESEGLAASLRDHGLTRVLRHGSGRPWLVGRWADSQLVRVSAGDRQLALLGSVLADRDRLAYGLGRITDVAGLDQLARTLPGSHYLCASCDGTVRVQGTLSGVRPVFRTAFRGLTLATGHPRVLAAVTGAEIDEERLGARLLLTPTWPLNDAPLWRGFDRLAPGHYLRMAPDGAARAVRWWDPPEPVVPVAEGAGEVRAALADAVAARTVTEPAAVSADLSGGMDSTSLAFLAADRVRDPLTTRYVPMDAANDDGVWAERAVRAIGGEHLALRVPPTAEDFAGLLDGAPGLDAPFLACRVQAMVRHQAAVLAERGARHHLTGHGGDELFYRTESLEHALDPRRPLATLRRLRSYQALYRRGPARLLREMSGRRGYPDTVREAARTLSVADGRTESRGWGIETGMPPWATRDALEHARRELAGAAGAGPLSPLRGQHTVLALMQQTGQIIRHQNQLTAGLGLTWHAPMIDDRVIESALAVRPEDHAEANRYKPVLVAAMRGKVPDDILERPTKGEFSADVYHGIRRHKEELLTLTEDMRLSRMGLVDADGFRRALHGPHPMPRSIIRLLSTLACEVWLRSLDVPVPAGSARREGA